MCVCAFLFTVGSFNEIHVNGQAQTFAYLHTLTVTHTTQACPFDY